MRILLIAGSFAPNPIGAAAVLAEQAAIELQRRGNEVFVLTAYGDPTAKGIHRWEAAEVPVVGLGIGPDGPADVEARTAAVLKMLQPDVVHAYSTQFLGYDPIKVANRMTIPTAITAMGRSRWPIDLLVRTSAVAVVAPGRRQALLDVPLAAAQVYVVPPGVAAPDPGWTRPTHRGPLRLGYLGGRHNGHQMLVDALAGLTRSDYELIAVDRATARGVRSLRAGDFPVPGLVRIQPRFSPSARDRFFGSIDVLVSLHQDPDSACLAVREGLLRGVWAIASDVAGAAAVVVPGGNGSLVRPDSPPDLGSALAWALEHRAVLAARQEAGAPAGDIPLIHDHVDALASMYRALIRAGDVRHP